MLRSLKYEANTARADQERQSVNELDAVVYIGFEPDNGEREIRSLIEAEQVAEYRALTLPSGYERAQALAEYWSTTARLDTARCRWRWSRVKKSTRHAL